MNQVGPFAINTIVQGDCIDLLKQVPDNSVDLIFADPPYNLQLHGELYRPNLTMVAAVHDAWDKFDSNEAYDQFCRAWLQECYRVLKNTGSAWVIGTYHNIFRVGTLLQNLRFWLLNDIVWIKTNPMPNFRGTRFNNAHETLIWAVKSAASHYTFHYRSMKTMNDDLQMRSDWVIPICKGGERIKTNGGKAHSTQKPEELLYRVILATSNPGDLVLDPFSGSGTTAAVAKRLGRNYLAFERDAAYVGLAKERLQSIAPFDHELLDSKVDKRRSRVPFGNLVEKGLVKAGELLYAKSGDHTAVVMADASVVCKDLAGSIHQVGAILSRGKNNNGWTYWLVRRNEALVCLDKLREEYEQTYLKPNISPFDLPPESITRATDFYV